MSNVKKTINQVRIVGGQWRSRKLEVVDAPGLRPTPGRIRETLFNWLAPVIVGARCLDLYAGSGALGFEALSRGAQQVDFIEKDPKVIKVLLQNAERLNAMSQTTIITADVLSTVDSTAFKQTPFDIIFIDPPYRQQLLIPTLQWVLEQGLIHQHSWIYFEAERHLDLAAPPGWQVYRHQSTKTLQYGLLQPERSLY